MFGLAGLTALSLSWMAVRALRGRRFGPKSAALLRSAYPVVLGLGGWFGAILLVTTTMSGVALDDELLATLSVGVPIGLAIYLAWLNRQGKAVGLAAALAGALAGAWLGFHAAADLLALLTCIVGAAAGANLTLILLDMSRSGSLAERAGDRRPRRANRRRLTALECRPSDTAAAGSRGGVAREARRSR
jgi:hypothetical protein